MTNRNNSVAARDRGQRRIGREEWRALAKRLNEHGRRLDTLMPIYHGGGVCDIPDLHCAACRRELAHNRFTALVDQVSGKPGRLHIDMAARCPGCDNVTLIRGDFQKKTRRGAALTLGQTSNRANEHAVSAASCPRAHPVSPVLPGPFDLVTRARLIALARGESPTDRARPLMHRVMRRLLQPGCAGTLTVAYFGALVLSLPWAPAQWSWDLIGSVYQAGTPLALTLWAVYELGVLWASQAPGRAGR